MKKLQNVYDQVKQVNDTTYSIDVLGGDNITSKIAEAIGLARGLDITMQFDFNGVTVSVRADSNPELIYRDWSRSLNGYIGESVGPYPKAELTDEEKASDARIEATNEREFLEYMKKENARRERVEAKLANAPGIELSDATGWQEFKDNSHGFYGEAVVNYTESWARLMQVEMANGKNLEDVVKTTSQELGGISDYAYRLAVSTLTSYWKYGDQLRRWYNDTQFINKKKNKLSAIIYNPPVGWVAKALRMLMKK